jgi:hypothetical protein
MTSWRYMGRGSDGPRAIFLKLRRRREAASLAAGFNRALPASVRYNLRQVENLAVQAVG